MTHPLPNHGPESKTGPGRRLRAAGDPPTAVDARAALWAAWLERSAAGRVDGCVHLGASAAVARYWLTWLPGGLFCGPCARRLGPVMPGPCDLCGRSAAHASWLAVTSSAQPAARDRAPTTIVALLCPSCHPR